MKKTHYLFKVLFICILASIFLCTLLIGCSKKDDNNSTLNTTIFAISFTYSDYLNPKDIINVGFSTNDWSIIPEVEANGKALNIGGLGGMYREIPYSDVLNYKVTANGKTTSGSIAMPRWFYDSTCNGDTLLIERAIVVDSSNIYNISWQPTKCDYQRFSFFEDDVFNFEMLDDSISNYIIYNDQLTNRIFEFDIDLVNGDIRIAGATPSVFGEYGEGFVHASSNYNYKFFHSPGGKSHQMTNNDNITPDERVKEFVKRFNDIWNNTKN